MNTDYDHSLDSLLALDGTVMFVDAGGNYSVKFVVKRIAATAERPHGLSYSLTLHGRDGGRIVGFDNAHVVSDGSGPGKRRMAEFDHKHVGSRVRIYDYSDAAALLADFWAAVDAALQKEEF